MDAKKSQNPAEILRFLPSVDTLLHSAIAKKIVLKTGNKYLTNLSRKAIDSLRQELLENTSDDKTISYSREDLLAQAESKMEYIWQSELNKSLKRVINATGVIIHTNLGRAPLSENAKRAIIEEASGYCSLEYDVETGKRGKRGGRAENLLAEITGAESALIVNNCAAAAVLVLTALSNGGESILSRGEMIEIGGDFRIPDVMTQSGANLIEVGTTNRTKISDYEKAITPNTRLILKVHPSNYRIIGFTSMPNVSELAELAHQNNILLYEDAGSGAIFDLSEFGLKDEPIIRQSISAGADVVTFSGDKLLGGTQSGLIVGKRDVIEKLRRHPLYRALRVDKIIYAALEATFEIYQRETALQEIPVLRMISMSNEELQMRTLNFSKKLTQKLPENKNLQFEVIEGKSVIGGGSAPDVQPITSLLALTHQNLSAFQIEKILRLSNPPIITRVLEDKVLIDLRTVFEDEESKILEILTNISIQ